MAVAGLHNVSAFGPSFFRESRSPHSRRWDDDRGSGPCTRASTLLQMWRELEGEHMVSQSYNRSRQNRNGSDSECSSTSMSFRQRSINSDDISQDSDESEDNNSVMSDHSNDLGENERERVRQTFREWMNSGFSKGNDCGSVRDGVVDVGSRIEQVRDGLAINHQEIGARRPIRRLCGRQTLLDLLMRAQSERKRDLLSLSERRPVSDFAHRNRIQALLRGRFLRNERMVLDERPSSVAATELGLLRQRHTVSGLREGFLSKLDYSASTSVNDAESDSSSTDGNNGESECREDEVTVIHTTKNLESSARGNRNTQELEVQVTEAEEPGLNDGAIEKDVSISAGSANNKAQTVLDTEARQQEVLTDVEYYNGIHGEQSHLTVTNESLSVSDTNYIDSLEVNNENDERRGASYVHEIDVHTTNSEGNTNEEFDSQDYSAQFFPEQSDNNVEEQDEMEISHEDWPSHELQEAIDSWLDMPSGGVSGSVGRTDAFYFPDDDNNVRSIELRELCSQRRVSSLLRSSFRESLDEMLQSHVERLGHVSGDWELENMSSFPVVLEQDQEQVNGDQTLGITDGAERNPFTPSSSTLFGASQALWGEEFQGENWTHQNPNQQLETEWEVINELRVDMARLQQRMNNMQSMLEACMDMQIELQHSVRQELSATLNRSFFPRGQDASHDNLSHAESQWDHVRKGLCCLCHDNKIDSLLYRCAHMCTCSKCAENLVQSMGKCPMCQAPAVEAVRAYCIQ